MSNTEQLAARLAEVEELIENAEERVAEIYAEGFAQFGIGFSLADYCRESYAEMAALRKERKALWSALGLQQ